MDSKKGFLKNQSTYLEWTRFFHHSIVGSLMTLKLLFTISWIVGNSICILITNPHWAQIALRSSLQLKKVSDFQGNYGFERGLSKSNRQLKWFAWQLTIQATFHIPVSCVHSARTSVNLHAWRTMVEVHKMI